MKPTLNDKIIAYMALAGGLLISLVAEYYSVMGLIAIYPAALIPIIVMGIAIGIGKLTATVWVKQNWSHAPILLKAYILPAIVILMFITSIGVFGFLSKAHSDQSLVSGDVMSKIAVYDDKIKMEKENVEANRKALKQMDEAVDQIMARSTTEGSADKAVAVRRSQQKERARLQAEISDSQKKITALSTERSPIAAEVRKVEAEVGPIKYIAAFIYGADPDSNTLERAVTWITILIVAILDPLAIVLLLASQYSFQRFRSLEEALESYEDVGDELAEFFERAKTTSQEIDAGTYVAPHETGTDDPIDFPKNVDQLPEDTVDFIFPHAGQGQGSLVEQLPGAPNSEVETAQINASVKELTELKEPEYFIIDDADDDEIPVEPSVYSPTLPSGHVPIMKRATPAPTKVFPLENYVQNEEQSESNLWTASTAVPITQKEYISKSQELLKGKE